MNPNRCFTKQLIECSSNQVGVCLMELSSGNDAYEVNSDNDTKILRGGVNMVDVIEVKEGDNREENSDISNEGM